MVRHRVEHIETVPDETLRRFAEQALTALQALQGMTVNAAHAAGEEHLAGRIAFGHRADLTVLAGDPLTVAATELPDLPVMLTVVDGRITHRDASL
ncbi:amidohydrolase family protein [Streptomyces sp. NPDC090036]|uniref:amidohydrolase family protein n=1 Tax=Streptomyces sp. NPDC090036 TaxID=3365926 RepID=UPI00381C5BAD